MALPEVTVATSLRGKILQGHPWIYRDHVHGGQGLPSGAWVRARCGGISAVGLWDARSPIAVRLFARQQAPDQGWFGERVWDAWELRAGLRAGPTNAYRWIYGEGDGLPGLVVDRYGDYAVAATYADSLATLLPWLPGALRACDHSLRGVLAREEPEGEGAGRLRRLWGEAPPDDLVVQEHGLYFHADLAHGQKTGLFLDQRENRRTVEGLAAGREVLNCFAYTGAFSLYALRGGAAHVTSADIGQGLAASAAANLALNGLPAERHSFVTEDCFTLLDEYARAGRTFQMVILDPPSFARSRQNLSAALRAYTRINALALRVVEPGGLLVSASCTSQVGPEAFRTMLGEAGTRAGCRLQIVHEAGHAADHPVPAAFPEGRYLKFVVARVTPAL